MITKKSVRFVMAFHSLGRPMSEVLQAARTYDYCQEVPDSPQWRCYLNNDPSFQMTLEDMAFEEHKGVLSLTAVDYHEILAEIERVLPIHYASPIRLEEAMEGYLKGLPTDHWKRGVIELVSQLSSLQLISMWIRIMLGLNVPRFGGKKLRQR